MALIQDGGGGRTTRPPTPESPWGDVYRRQRTPTPSTPVGLTPQQVYPYAAPWSPYSWAPSAPAGAGGGVTIRVGPEAAPAAWQPQQPQQPQYANWWEAPGAMQPAAPAAAPPISMPTPWGQYANPLWEGMGAPQDWLNLRAQDWAALPREVRSELERWLRGFGWRPGGRYGRYGALEWGRAEGATPWAQAGQQLGQEAFAGVPENLKPWLYFLSQAKGWMQGPATRPETTGWSW